MNESTEPSMNKTMTDGDLAMLRHAADFLEDKHSRAAANALRALLAAQQPEPRAEVTGWQPIETAPKDGTDIIIACIEDGTVFDVCNGHFEVVAEDEDDGPWDIRDGEPWCSYVGREAGTYFATWLPGKEWESKWKITETFEYTHWMARPEAPDATRAGEGQ